MYPHFFMSSMERTYGSSCAAVSRIAATFFRISSRASTSASVPTDACAAESGLDRRLRAAMDEITACVREVMKLRRETGSVSVCSRCGR